MTYPEALENIISKGDCFTRNDVNILIQALNREEDPDVNKFCDWVTPLIAERDFRGVYIIYHIGNKHSLKVLEHIFNRNNKCVINILKRHIRKTKYTKREIERFKENISIEKIINRFHIIDDKNEIYEDAAKYIATLNFDEINEIIDKLLCKDKFEDTTFTHTLMKKTLRYLDITTLPSELMLKIAQLVITEI